MSPLSLCLTFVLLSGLTEAQILEMSPKEAGIKLHEAQILEMHPKKAGIEPHKGINIKCVSNISLAECQFRVRHHYVDKNQPAADDGPIFNNTAVHGFGTRYNLPYNVENGTGLVTNECGIQLSNVTAGRYLVGCRARAQQTDWEERYMALYVDDMSKTFTSNNAENDMIMFVNFNNESAEIKLKLEFKNEFKNICQLEGVQNIKLRENQTPTYTNKKLCTLKIVANESALGPMWATAQVKNEKDTLTWHFMKIIVVTKPKSTSLVLSSPSAENYTENEAQFYTGDTVNATCSVHESRRGADIIWTLDNETLVNGTSGLSFGNEMKEGKTSVRIVNTINNTNAWTWPWETKTIEQTISMTLDLNDDGKTLECIARYQNSTEEVPSSNITFTIKPLTTTTPTPTSTKATSTTNASIPTVLMTVEDVISGRSLTQKNQFLTVLIVSLCLVLALAIAAALVYGRFTRKYCFKQPANSTDGMLIVQQPQSMNKAAAASTKAKEQMAKPRARTPETLTSSVAAGPGVIQSDAFDGEEQVVYAEIASNPAARDKGRTKVTLTEETTYAELSFE